tara:strand:+ start:534 stop:1511 length:978 start_codon:yes stop_codon:yes gene_type:complete
MAHKKYKYQMKPAFEERMKLLMPDAADFSRFSQIIHKHPLKFIRCNTLKIEPQELLSRLTKKGWTVVQPFEKHPEIMLIESELEPGGLGKSPEHILGLYYVQEISSMLPPLALDPQPGEFILDAFASPGSKTTQMASYMENTGTIIANELKLDRIKILTSNLERCGVTNTLVSRQDAVSLCNKLAKTDFKFDKILLDAPCSGSGTLRSSPKTFKMWNPKVVKKLGRQQKVFFASAIKCLKVGGTLVYSTCTHAPEENEAVVSFALENFPVKIESLSLPLKCRPGISEWKSSSFEKGTEKSCRIYPQDNDSEGFFVSKFTLLEEIK